jgi:hypothetical protein
MRINEIITEAAAPGQEIQFVQLTLEEAVNVARNDCKDAAWMLQNNSPIWRGFSSNEVMKVAKTGFASANPALTVRVSQNTRNYYTIILDGLPSMSRFPKRSRSFIATTHYATANGYASGDPLIVIPFDGVKIGSVNRQDMWDTKITIAGVRKPIEFWNYYWSRLDLPVSSYEEFTASLKSKTPEEIFSVIGVTGVSGEEIAKLVEVAYSPKKTGFTYYTTKNIAPIMNEIFEFWIGGPCLLINKDMWEPLKAALKNSKGTQQNEI